MNKCEKRMKRERNWDWEVARPIRTSRIILRVEPLGHETTDKDCEHFHPWWMIEWSRNKSILHLQCPNSPQLTDLYLICFDWLPIHQGHITSTYPFEQEVTISFCHPSSCILAKPSSGPPLLVSHCLVPRSLVDDPRSTLSDPRNIVILMKGEAAGTR